MKKLYKDLMRLAQYYGRRQGNEAPLREQVGSAAGCLSSGFNPRSLPQAEGLHRPGAGERLKVLLCDGDRVLRCLFG